MTAKEFAIKAHQDTNHFYDTYLPYEFHLRMVVKVAEQFKHLIVNNSHSQVMDACWLHDTIEDCRINYAEINKNFGAYTAEIVRACTNYTRGRNRYERMPAECYQDLRNTENATFVKLCDRIANVQYSKMTGSSMFSKYKKEYETFHLELCYKDEFKEMWQYLEGLF